jgi:hypothetical protein
VITDLGTLDFVAAKENVVFLGPPNSRPATPGTPGPRQHQADDQQSGIEDHQSAS